MTRIKQFTFGFIFLCLCQGCALHQPISKQTWSTLRVGNYNLAYMCAGSTRPTLILESPSGVSTEQAYEKILPALTGRHRTCFVERLGFGKSDQVPSGLTQTTKDYAEEVTSLVDKVAPRERVVVVGYSFGGMIARYFAAVHPDRVAGLVLIDAVHEDWLKDAKHRMQPDDWAKMQGILDWFKKNLGHNYWDSQFEVAAVSLPASMPVRIISRGLPFQRIRKANLSEDGFRIYNESHDAQQLKLLTITNNTSRVIAKKSAHFIVDSEPEVVLGEIEELYSQIRKAH
ncbi:MAG: alpha/beta hydrolase [Luteimonas sp.]